MKLKKFHAALMGVGAIILAIIVVDLLKPKPIITVESKTIITPVTVVQVTPTMHQPRINLLAMTASRWPLQLKATSHAQLIWLKPNIEPGQLVEKGTELAKLDTAALASNLAQADSDVKQAELGLQQALQEQTVALKMISASHSSAFARREPQVAAAQAEITRARQAYAYAEKQLQEATLTAPFNAIVMRRQVSPGEWLSAGQTLFDIAAADALDIQLPMSEFHWQQVQPWLNELTVQVMNREGIARPAKVRYLSPSIDPSTHQRQLVLSVDHPYQGDAQLLPNQQVTVQIALGKQPDIAQLPASAVTRDGFVWVVNEDNRLQKEWITLIEQTQDEVYARFNNAPGKRRNLVVYPLLSMLPGKNVLPQPLSAITETEAAE